MCEFASFMVTADGQVYAGNLQSHNGIEIGWDLQPGGYREAEWIRDDHGASLHIRCGILEHEGQWKNKVLARYPNRSALLHSLTLGKGDQVIFHLQNGQLHRDDGPAVEWADGGQEWWQHGEMHRDDGPSMEYIDGTKAWHQGGALHRDDGPALKGRDGTTYWYQHGQLHRDDGPAVEYPDGAKYWYQHGARTSSSLDSSLE